MLVGHSYGGVVITNAATGNANVKALVYIAAYAPDQGDTVLEPLARSARTARSARPRSTSRRSRTRTAASARRARSSSTSSARSSPPTCSKKLARNMALAQRPASLVALGEPSGPPAWKTIPSYYMIAGADKAIGADVEVAMAKRIKPEEDRHGQGRFSHVVMISQPKTTADFILEAAKTS